MRNIVSFFCFLMLCAVASFGATAATRESIWLGGDWRYFLPDAPDSIPSSGFITLPATLDSHGIGVPKGVDGVTDALSRKVRYTGEAAFSREIKIPESWRGKEIFLIMERTRPASVTIDGAMAGESSLISAPHRHNVSRLLTPGTHTIEITVDNSAIPAAVRNNSHACSEDTQTNWNGILGDFRLEARDPWNIADVIPSVPSADGIISLAVFISQYADLPLTVKASLAGYPEQAAIICPDENHTSVSLPLPSSASMWSEWNPVALKADVSLFSPDGHLLDQTSVTIPSRRFETNDKYFTINGKQTFLRGRTDACVFPLTAHTPTDIDSWRNYFATLRSYGLNHVRFHTWCPPEACFQAADEAGFYLQVELPLWGELDRERERLVDFLQAEAEGIVKEYSAHPSFTMLSLGNELWGDLSLMKEIAAKVKAINPALPVAYSSNLYLGWKGYVDGEDYMVAARIGEGSLDSCALRGSFSFADHPQGGVIHSAEAASTGDYSAAVSLSPVPVVSHEVGQYQSYPDFSISQRLSGPLTGENFDTFRLRADEAGTLRKADRFREASSKWAQRLYKADIERITRTQGLAGYQLLDIQDYPGQGTALVGILDLLMQPKKGTSLSDWRMACNDVTILAQLDRFCLPADTIVEVALKVANYSGKSLEGHSLRYSFGSDRGEIAMPHGEGLLELPSVAISVNRANAPYESSLHLEIEGIAENLYPLWIYPRKVPEVKNVTTTTNIDEALHLLAKGKRVILAPDSASIAAASLPPLFQTDFWNYRIYRTICDKIGTPPSPGTLGLLIDNQHPSLSLFPSSSHSDWQWQQIVAASRPLVIDRLPKEIDPVVEVIDNVERNYRLALLLECVVGKGKLMILPADISMMESSIEGRWFLHSLKKYMASNECKPDLSLSPEQVRNLLTRPSTTRLVKELRIEASGF